MEALAAEGVLSPDHGISRLRACGGHAADESTPFHSLPNIVGQASRPVYPGREHSIGFERGCNLQRRRPWARATGRLRTQMQLQETGREACLTSAPCLVARTGGKTAGVTD
jgi:hypothetical protein